MKIRTQKAKGIISALHELNAMSGYLCVVPSHRLVQSKEEIEDGGFWFPYFARPCPTIPRHGFVESRTVSNKDELLKLWDKVMVADPNGEIVLGPHYSNVEYNTVLVSSGLLSIGEKNDGATGGRKSISIPIVPLNLCKELLGRAGLGENDVAFIESILVSNSDLPQLVQLRGGPAIQHESDFIPKRTIVKKIVQPHNDLLKWEQEVKDFTDGTVVYGEGYTLASHAAIHCVLHKIPFITTKQPKVGDVLKSSENQTIKINRYLFNKGARVGLKFNIRGEYRTSSKFMARLFFCATSIIHNWAYIRKSEHASWLLGAASAIFAKICAALIMGEYRHRNKNTISREALYDDVLASGPNVFNKLPRAFEDFYSRTWEEGFGGIPWATCTWYTHSLWKEITKAMNKDTTYLSQNESTNIITFINKLLNLAHNNGWWFNKIVDEDRLTELSTRPGFLALYSSGLYYQIYKGVNRLRTKKKVRVKNIKSVPFFRDREGNIVWVSIGGVDGDWETKRPTATIFFTRENTKCFDKGITIKHESFELVYKLLERKGLSCDDYLVYNAANGKVRLPGYKRAINVERLLYET